MAQCQHHKSNFHNNSYPIFRHDTAGIIRFRLNGAQLLTVKCQANKIAGVTHTHTQANIFALFSPSAIHLFFNIVSAHNVNTPLCGNKNEIFSRLCVTSVALTGCTWKHICEKRSIVAVVVDAHDAHQPKFIGNFLIEIDVLGHTFTWLHYFADMYSVTV